MTADGDRMNLKWTKTCIQQPFGGVRERVASVSPSCVNRDARKISSSDVFPCATAVAISVTAAAHSQDVI